MLLPAVVPLIMFDDFKKAVNTSMMFDIHINGVEKLLNRPDAISYCNASLNHVDKTYLSAVMESVGCVPAYWEHFVSTWNIALNKNASAKCNTTINYQMMKEYLPYYGNVTKGTQLYTPSCNKMMVTYDMTKSDSDGSGLLEFKIHYSTDNYKEIRNIRQFGLYDLWSQIGGFVGIFLGYSLLQIPEIITNLISWLTKTIKAHRRRTLERSHVRIVQQPNAEELRPSSNNTCEAAGVGGRVTLNSITIEPCNIPANAPSTLTELPATTATPESLRQINVSKMNYNNNNI